jgi:DNA-binding transcriptional regulator YiaG
MKKKKRTTGQEIIAGLKEFAADLKSGIPLHEKYTVRTVRAIPPPREYRAADVLRIRELVGVSQAVFASMLGVSVALVRSWESAQRRPAPIARRMLDMIRENPASWRAMLNAA